MLESSPCPCTRRRALQLAEERQVSVKLQKHVVKGPQFSEEHQKRLQMMVHARWDSPDQGPDLLVVMRAQRVRVCAVRYKLRCIAAASGRSWRSKS
jgi:hypothetical protein